MKFRILSSILIGLNSVIIFGLAAILFLGGQSEYEQIRQDLARNFIIRFSTFAVFGLPSIILIALLYMLFKPDMINIKKTLLFALVAFIISSLAGTTFFFFH